MKATIAAVLVCAMMLSGCSSAARRSPEQISSVTFDDGVVLRIVDRSGIVIDAERAPSTTGGLFPSPPFGIGTSYSRLSENNLALGWSQALCEKSPEVQLKLDGKVIVADLYRGPWENPDGPCLLALVEKGIVLELPSSEYTVQFAVHTGNLETEPPSARSEV
jgi:hypothetical protein